MPFKKDNQKKDGLCSYCVSCVKIKNANKYLKNKDTILLVNKKWRITNREKALMISKIYRDKNKESQSLKSAIKYAKNPEKYKIQIKKYRSENPSKQPFFKKRYLARKLQAIPKWANEHKIQEFYETAQGLNMLLGEWHHVDHIVPLKSKLVCGLHWEGNLQILTAKQNISKGNRWWPDMP
jgi:hypothetical protein